MDRVTSAGPPPVGQPRTDTLAILLRTRATSDNIGDLDLVFEPEDYFNHETSAYWEVPERVCSTLMKGYRYLTFGHDRDSLIVATSRWDRQRLASSLASNHCRSRREIPLRIPSNPVRNHHFVNVTTPT